MAWSERPYEREYGSPMSGPATWSGTIWLIAVTVGVQVLIWAGGGTFGPAARAAIEWFSVREGRFFSFELWRPFTYLFLHGGVGHLFWNMLILFFMGRAIEPEFGRKRFIILYIAYGYVAAYGFALQGVIGTLAPGAPAIGASGAILGLVVTFGFRFPDARVFLMFVPVTGKVLALIMVGLDLLGILASQGTSGTAYSIHLAGAAAAAGYCFVWPRLEVHWLSLLASRERDRARRVAERRRVDEQEMDRILEKISDRGMAELTEREREFLRRQSERLKSGR